MSVDFGRRNFLKGSASLGATLSLTSFAPLTAKSFSTLLQTKIPSYKSWDDIYREQWTWDRVVRGTHLVNCWYQAHCSWDVYVKDGLVFREEQAGEYPQVNSELPDFNPRGCQKGACFSERMYEPVRIKYPMKRVGRRGSGRWERVSWEKAMDDIADTYLDVISKEDTDRVILDMGTNVDLGTSAAGVFRFSGLSRAILLDPNAENGDAHRGCAETFGKMTGDRSLDDYFYSDLILIWGCNPVYTQIPNAHFYQEARYNGTRIITIAPDYNASAVHADLWVPVKPGTDAALALSIAYLLIENGDIDHGFIKEQTDLPFLVRMDTRGFLMDADINENGDPEQHLFIDEKSNEIRQAPRSSLELEKQNPALEINREITLVSGETVTVRTVFSLLKDRLKNYTPEKAAKACGTGAGMIRRLAKEITQAKALSNVTTSNLGKYYHGNLMERSIILLFALTGQFGRKGTGYSAFPMIVPEGLGRFSEMSDMNDWQETIDRPEPDLAAVDDQGNSHEINMYNRNRHAFGPGETVTSGGLFWSVHGGLVDIAEQEWDPFLKSGVKTYLDKALENNWQTLKPAREDKPRILFHIGSNPLKRVRGTPQLLKNLWPELKLSVVLDWRMNSTGKYADYILPCAASYERTGHRMVTTLSPYMTLNNAAVKPYGESMPDWGIFALLTKHVQRRAKQRGLSTYTDKHGKKVRLSTMYDDFTLNGEFRENDDEKVMKAIFDLSDSVEGTTWDELKEKGFARHTSIGDDVMSIGNMCDVPENDSITHFTYHTEKKVPWPTATRRIQFYLDQELYHELDEVLPRHKAPPTIGGNYPLMMTSGHARETIHGSWRDNKTMLRLSRGEPFIVLSPQDAARRKIADTDWVRVYNDVGEYVVRAKISPAAQPGQTIIYHAWENYQFPKGSPRYVMPSPLNPVELSGDYDHLRSVFGFSQPNHFDRDTRIEIERHAEKINS